MAARLGKPEGAFRYNNMIQLGSQVLPIDTAVSWSVCPDYTVIFPHKQIYTVIVRLNVLKDGKPNGLAEYCLHADSLRKAASLVAILRRNNVQWSSCLEGLQVSSARKTIRLTFADGVVGKVLNDNGSVSRLNGRDVFLLMRKAAGLEMADEHVKKEGYNSVDLTFDGEPEQAAAAMQETLRKMERLFAGNVVFQALAGSRFKVDKAESVPVVEGKPVSFDVWEDEIIGEEHNWEASDISWFLLSVKKRPEKK